MQRDVGAVVMAAAMINDLLGWSLFAVILRGANNSPGLAPRWSVWPVFLPWCSLRALGLPTVVASGEFLVFVALSVMAFATSLACGLLLKRLVQ